MAVDGPLLVIIFSSTTTISSSIYLTLSLFCINPGYDVHLLFSNIPQYSNTSGAAHIAPIILFSSLYLFIKFITLLSSLKLYAPVIVNGKSSLGVGGGVCQISSTMYNTQLKAGILPTERRNHSKPVSYVPRGLDATLASGSIDYKFKNTYDYPIIINTYTKDSNLYIEFWSNKEVNKNITYEPISFTNGRSAQTYLYGYDVGGNKVYEKFIDTSIYR